MHPDSNPSYKAEGTMAEPCLLKTAFWFFCERSKRRDNPLVSICASLLFKSKRYISFTDRNGVIRPRTE